RYRSCREGPRASNLVASDVSDESRHPAKRVGWVTSPNFQRRRVLHVLTFARARERSTPRISTVARILLNASRPAHMDAPAARSTPSDRGPQREPMFAAVGRPQRCGPHRAPFPGTTRFTCAYVSVLNAMPPAYASLVLAVEIALLASSATAAEL